ncbi:MSMEG_0570 family nitrogen starvation response protein [Streptomyces sp. NBC_01803]|uniref:MSMEG_0570 family nitrogen starvation response protein n=1 Tax=Streptomyces sp. NBC_01803 TaxID=2975946 RepID=UPI002DD8BC42|nr:MSMEG_0570 family nitrogen starvation response protein [Streptomyces sp. NBC_01803]WSA43611.1 MSMEG_0570 family nitrogen starvation response protein [Streptomyces sp. NBC_01803]
MPEMYFRVRWPDGGIQRCYSPSTVVQDFFESGTGYPVDDFVDRSRRALTIAGERVRATYGFACTSAAEQLAQIEATAAAHAASPGATADDRVVVEALTGPDGSER